jgi:uncharacterized membrane protein
VTLRRIAGPLTWAVVVILSGYYFYRAFSYRFLTPGQLGPDLLNKQIWYVTHLLGATLVLLGAPLQFIPSLRQRRPQLHRLVGRLYVIGATIGACTAMYLGAVISEEGSRLPIMLLGALWLFFTLSAWRCAVAKRFAAHRQFMIRSYGLAMVLVWLRLMFDFQSVLFFYVTDEAMRDATREWASWVVPLLVLELWLSWIPLLSPGRASAEGAR